MNTSYALIKIQFAAALFILSSCSSLIKKPSYNLTKSPNHSLYFNGRGAASGPMLMSAMGPAGIAVGLAIDVGIGKDIEKSAFKDGLKVEELIADSVGEITQTSKLNQQYFSQSGTTNFQLNKIGFIELPGQNDHVQPSIELSVYKEAWQKTYRYPEDFQSDKNVPGLGATLEQLKSPQSPARKLLQHALTQVIQKSITDWQTESLKGKNK